VRRMFEESGGLDVGVQLMMCSVSKRGRRGYIRLYGGRAALLRLRGAVQMLLRRSPFLLFLYTTTILRVTRAFSCRRMAQS